MTFVSDLAPTENVETHSGRIAYRRFGAATGVPLVLFQRYRGTIDHWDPALLEVLAAERPVVIFDGAGVGFSTGTTPTSIAAMASAALEFVDALGLTEIDAFGWSMGGFVAQLLTLERPGLVRRLLVTGSGPGGSNGAPGADAKIPELMLKEENDDEDYLFLFFGLTEEGRRLGLESLRRLDTRLAVSKIDSTPEAYGNQLQAIVGWGSDENAAWPRLAEIEIPVLVANGSHDVMVDAYNSFAMSQRLTNATTLLYSDSGHGFLFQHPEEFGQVVVDFLR